MLVKRISETLSLDFSRIQFTPDLMPMDITGTDILQDAVGGKREFQFVHGPVFANIVHKAITNSHLLLVKRAGHIVMYDQAQACNEAMLAFLAGTTNPHP